MLMVDDDVDGGAMMVVRWWVMMMWMMRIVQYLYIIGLAAQSGEPLLQWLRGVDDIQVGPAGGSCSSSYSGRMMRRRIG